MRTYSLKCFEQHKFLSFTDFYFSIFEMTAFMSYSFLFYFHYRFMNAFTKIQFDALFFKRNKSSFVMSYLIFASTTFST